MKAQKQKAGRTPQSPRANTATLTVEMTREEAAPWLALPKKERNETATHAIREFLRLKQCAKTLAGAHGRKDAVAAEFDRRREALACVFSTGGANSPVAVAIGQDRKTGRWCMVRGDDNLSVTELSLQETLRELARLYERVAEGYIAGHDWDNDGMAALLTESSEAITLLRQQRVGL